MKIIFFGLGSIGKRHAKILFDDYKHQLFAYRTNRGQEKNDLGIEEVYTWGEVKNIRPEAAFITNPTSLHVDTALRCIALGIQKLFIEKPISSSLKNLNLLLREVSRKKIVTYVAYNLRYHPVVIFLKKYLESRKIYHVSIYNSSYLPSWRPNQDYRKSYSVSSKRGGGVILDLSHEFDYIEHLFGKITKISGIFGRASMLTQDSEDFMDAAMVTARTHVNLHQNFLSLHKERTIKVDCKDEFIFADLVSGEIRLINEKGSLLKKYAVDIDKLYTHQMRYFFENIDNQRMMNNLREASILLKKVLEFKKMKR